MNEVVIYFGRPIERSFYDEIFFHRWVCGDPLRAQQKDVYCKEGFAIKELTLPEGDVRVVCEYPSQSVDEPSCGAQRDVRITLKGSQEKIGDVERIIKAAEREASKKQEVGAGRR